ncbi:MAG: DUF5689 domain-containing protein [Bacteroidales bacterium]|nr:DUF5689 domain-containing protein [Bacteroidales bacterium]
MKKIFFLFAAAMMAFSMTSCLDQSEEPDVQDYTITASNIPAANTTIAAMKEKFSSQMSTNNTFKQVNEDIIFEGVVVGNDISGNLYQTVILRSIESTPGAADDQCIQLGIKNTFISPYFPLGQRLRVNLNGLYVGNYSKTPKVGQPYYTSAGNLRLGPMLFQMCGTNIQLVGKPNTNAPELTPLELSDDWFKDAKNQNYKNSPMLAKATGIIKEMQGNKAERPSTGELSGEKEPLPKIFAPKALYDAGYAVDRTLVTNAGEMTIRTSTQNDIAYLPLPADSRTYTGIFSFYSGWQIQLRDVDDIYPMIK